MDGANWHGYAGQNPMVYVDRIGVFYYTGNVQQSSNDTKQTGTESAETPNGMPQNQTPNITGPTGEQTPAVPNVETDGKYSSRRLNAGLQIILGIEVGIEMNISWEAWTKLWRHDKKVNEQAVM